MRVKIPLWAPWFICFLGIFLIVSPATFGYCGTALAISDLISGALLLICGWRLRRSPTAWLCWLATSVGVWLEFAPILLKIEPAVGYLSDTLVGLLVIFASFLMTNVEEKKGGEIPDGWSYNPSSFVQRIPVVALTLMCWLLSRYLTAYQLGFIQTMWEPFFGSGTIDVITSEISRALPVPDAGIGAFAYTLEFVLGCHGGSARWRTSPWLVLSFGLLVIPVGLVSILLITLQPLVVHAWCTVCLATALAMLLMIMLTIDEVCASLQLLRKCKREGMNLKKVFWEGASCGKEDLSLHKVTLSSPWRALCKESVRGCGMPWNLALSALIGVIFMLWPSWGSFSGVLADADHVIGALIIVFSVVSMAEVIRGARFVLWPLAILIVSTAVVSGEGSLLWKHLVVALLLSLLALKRGEIKESMQDV